MMKKIRFILWTGIVLLACLLMVGCGSNGGSTSAPQTQTQTGQVVTFGTDAPICDVESFIATITSASLVPQGGGTGVPLITSTAPATVDFARLTEFTNILSTANVAPNTYSQLQVNLSSPAQLIALNPANPSSPVTMSATLTATNLTIDINPGLVVSDSTTTGLTLDFNLRKSLQVDGNGQVTGTVDPQITATAATTSGTTVGEADSLYGVVQSTSTSNLPTGFTGSFQLTVADGAGQTYTILSNSSTVFEGDGVTTFSDLTANTFVEVDAIVNTSGQIIAQTVDAEEQTSPSSQKSAFLGKILNVTQDGSGNATSFTLLVNEEIPSLNGSVPLHSGLNVAVSSSTKFHINRKGWNHEGFAFNSQTLWQAEKVAVFGTLGSGSPPTMAATHIFLRPRTVTGNFIALAAAGSDGMTGGFTMLPCGVLFGGNPITVLTYPTTNFNGFSTLTQLTAAPTLIARGLLFYEQANGSSNQTGVSWTGPTWVLETKGVHQLPN